MHLSADAPVAWERLTAALKDIDNLRDTFGNHVLLEKLKLVIQDSIHVESMEIEDVSGKGNSDSGNGRVSQLKDQRQSAQVAPLPPSGPYGQVLQTWPHSGKTVEVLSGEVGGAGLEYLASMPNTHPDDKAIILNYLARDEIDFL